MKKKYLSIIIFLAAFALPAGPVMGQTPSPGSHIKPYGNLYMFYGYVRSTTFDAAGKEEVDDDTLYKINNNSNLGFNFDYARYKGVFELGIDDFENERKVTIRKAFGEYNLGFGKLMLGQNWNPYVKWSHETADYYRSEGFGSLYEDPCTQVKFTSNLGIYLGIIRPNVPTKKYYTQQEVYNPDASSTADVEYENIEVEREITTKQPLENIKSMVPKVVLGYDFNSRIIDFAVGAAGNMYYIDKTENVEFNKNWIISYLFYLNLELKLNSFVFNMSGGYAVNPANFGISIQSEGNTYYSAGAAASIHNIATGEYEIKDTWNVQGYTEFGYYATSTVLIHLGYGFSLMDYPMENTKKDYAMEYYLNVKINMGGLIAITPSVSYRDYMKDMAGEKEGNDIYGGILATVSYY